MTLMSYDTKQQQEYKKKNMTQFKVSWHNVSDADIIQKLDSVPNKADYVRQLIRADIEREEDNMENYKIKPEYYDLWGCTEDTAIIDRAEIERLAEEWEKTVE